MKYGSLSECVEGAGEGAGSSSSVATVSKWTKYLSSDSEGEEENAEFEEAVLRAATSSAR